MRQILIGTIALIVLSGCVETTVTRAWREGATPSTQVSAVTDCQAYAARQVPAAMSMQTTPVYRTPSNVQCSTYGNYTSCQQYGGQVYGGQSYSYDANADLRYRVTLQCLAQKGYQVYDFPRCTPDQAKNAVPLGRLPAANRIVCLTDNERAVLN